MHISIDGHQVINQLKIPSMKEKAHLAITTLIQHWFTMEEIVELDPRKTNDDNKRYQIIRGKYSFRQTTETKMCLSFRGSLVQISTIYLNVGDHGSDTYSIAII